MHWTIQENKTTSITMVLPPHWIGRHLNPLALPSWIDQRLRCSHQARTDIHTGPALHMTKPLPDHHCQTCSTMVSLKRHILSLMDPDRRHLHFGPNLSFMQLSVNIWATIFSCMYPLPFVK